jgi:SAM-dependent methyltransferase
MRINEFSPNTLKGSFTDDLIVSKLWLIREISKIHKDFNSIYILGSWYGNLSLFLLDKNNIQFKKIINVDINKKVLSTGQELATKFGVADKIEPMVKDANDLDYRQARPPSLVINTSVNDMENDGWFDNIPTGTLVAIQTRDESLDQFKFTKILYSGGKELKDPEDSYIRNMIIGVK